MLRRRTIIQGTPSGWCPHSAAAKGHPSGRVIPPEYPLPGTDAELFRRNTRAAVSRLIRRGSPE